MADSDRRMHEGRTPGLVPGRGHEHHEDPVTDADAIGTPAPPPRSTDQSETEEAGTTVDREQASALGGETATRSGTAPTPEDERRG